MLKIEFLMDDNERIFLNTQIGIQGFEHDLEQYKFFADDKATTFINLNKVKLIKVRESK